MAEISGLVAFISRRRCMLRVQGQLSTMKLQGVAVSDFPRLPSALRRRRLSIQSKCLLARSSLQHVISPTVDEISLTRRTVDLALITLVANFAD